MAEAVAQHEGADLELLSVGGDPCVRHDRVVHGLVLGHRRRQVIHAGDTHEPGRLGGLCSLDQLREGEPHLR